MSEPARTKPVAAVDWSPRFKSMEEVDKAVIRLRQIDLDVDLGLLSQLEDVFAGEKPQGDPALSIEWLDRAQRLIEVFSDVLEGLKGEHAERLADLNPAQIQSELAKTEQQVRSELNTLKGTRFAAERAAWRERVEKNLAALALKQTAQAAKLKVTHEVMPDGRIVVRPDDEWWRAYTAWLFDAHEVLRDHLDRLLLDRWPRFIEDNVRPVVRALDASFSVELPEIELDRLPNPVSARGRERSPWSDAPPPDAGVTPPEEVLLSHEIDRSVASGSAQGGPLGLAQRFLPALLSPMVMLIPQVGSAAKVLVGVAVAVPAVVIGMRKQRAVRALVLADRVERSTETLRKKLETDFQRRMGRHKMDVEAYVRDYNAAVQQRIFAALSQLVDTELQRRGALLPQQRQELLARKQRLQARVAVLDQSSKAMSGVLVDLELRRRALRDELHRRAAGGTAQ